MIILLKSGCLFSLNCTYWQMSANLKNIQRINWFMRILEWQESSRCSGCTLQLCVNELNFHNPVNVCKSNYQENLSCSQLSCSVVYNWQLRIWFGLPGLCVHLVISALLIQMLHIRNLIQPTFLRGLEVDWNCEIPPQFNKSLALF